MSTRISNTPLGEFHLGAITSAQLIEGPLRLDQHEGGQDEGVHGPASPVRGLADTPPTEKKNIRRKEIIITERFGPEVTSTWTETTKLMKLKLRRREKS